MCIRDRVCIGGELAHRVHIESLRRSYGEYLRIINQIQVVLYHIIFEFLMIQASVADSLYEGMSIESLPDLFGIFQQAFYNAHSAYFSSSANLL